MSRPQPIKVLSESTSSRIAAGEVVERPANVVKELIENSIDAGATEITVEIEKGGKRLIRVTDNGQGIPSDQVELAFRPHATSKIVSSDDLERITTLGFRGEALTSIAAVSQVTIVTRASRDEAGTKLLLDCGSVVLRESVGAPTGTRLTSENLFHAVPARLKFLRADATESAHIGAIVSRYALAYADRRFVLIRDGRSALRSDGDGIGGALRAVFGLDIARELLRIGGEVRHGSEADWSPDAQSDGAEDARVLVSGYVSPPHLHRATRQHISLFVNGRWVHDKSLTYAVVQAYHTLLPSGRFPLAVIFISLPAELVDVNVHPAKTEVRFRESRQVFSAVERAVRRAVVGGAPVAPLGYQRQAKATSASTGRWRTPFVSEAEAGGRGQGDWVVAEPGAQPAMQLSESALPILRVLGQALQTYIVAEGPDGLYLIDQHAAHERVMYEQMSARHEQPAAQQLLSPEPVQLQPAEMAALEHHKAAFASLGFEIEPFGPDTALVRSVPEGVSATGIAGFVTSVMDEAVGGGNLLESNFEEQLIRAVCKQATIKAGQTLTIDEMQGLIRSLEATTSPRTCPHGRPTMTVLSAGELASGFGRR
jgi:DNA mismatch repair protein MutL